MRLTVQVCNFYLLRHGKVDGDAALNGHSDKLVDGVVQERISQAICRRAIAFDHIITSPLRRCADLALLLKKKQPAVKMSIEEQLREISFGTLDGQAFDSIKDKWPLLDAFWQNPAENTLPEAETLSDFRQRIVSAWSKIIETERDNTLIITHGGVIRMILADALQLDWQNPLWHSRLAIANASITHIQISKAEQHYISVRSIAVDL
ncbi:histidine phosphatase family protein [Psychromonas sp.]|uniref:histidine phosphatase family protein n=1 Tax=Psychromonas sp. TaxID=1884585 RepID=UPI00356205DF